MHYISFADMSAADVESLLDRAEDLKRMRKAGVITDYLKNRSLAMIFEKSSTRTRVSFEVGMTDLGGHALYLDPVSMQIGRGETVADTGRILSSYVHGIMVRAKNHDMVTELARNSRVPVINGLSDREHPCQVLADLLTIGEKKGRIKGLKFTWVGDGNNVCNSLMLACAMMGMEMAVACPEGYEPDQAILAQARAMGGKIAVMHDVEAASKNADILYTDVWVSMGQEAEKERRIADLRDYQINMRLIGMANPGCLVMHCLPAHRDEEITDEAIQSPSSVIFEQAENRLHAQKALLIKLLGRDMQAFVRQAEANVRP